MGFFLRKLDVGPAGAAERVALVDMGSEVRPDKTSCFVADGLAKPLHIRAITVDRLHRTAKFPGNIFDHYALHAASAGDFKSDLYDHVLCDPLFWHCHTSI